MAAEDNVREKGKLADLRRAVADDPNSPKRRFKLGMALYEARLVKQSAEELRKALELDPGFIKGWVNLGGVLLAAWDFSGCVEANEKALELDPAMLEAHYNKGLGHLYQGQAAELVECCKRVLELDPRHAGGHYHMAVGLYELGQVGQARRHVAMADSLGHAIEHDFMRALAKDERGREGEVPPAIEVEPRKPKHNAKKTEQNPTDQEK